MIDGACAPTADTPTLERLPMPTKHPLRRRSFGARVSEKAVRQGVDRMVEIYRANGWPDFTAEDVLGLPRHLVVEWLEKNYGWRES